MDTFKLSIFGQFKGHNFGDTDPVSLVIDLDLRILQIHTFCKFGSVILINTPVIERTSSISAFLANSRAVTLEMQGRNS